MRWRNFARPRATQEVSASTPCLDTEGGNRDLTDYSCGNKPRHPAKPSRLSHATAKIGPITIFLMTLCSMEAIAGQTPPTWIDVPESLGPVAGATCQTRPTGVAVAPAVIVCDPTKLALLPPPAQVFLRAHEHGHVYQLVHTPAIFYGPRR